jgi:Skp family chaperone for outer membrane proteins
MSMKLRNYRRPLMAGGLVCALLVVAVVAYQMGSSNYQVSQVTDISAQAATAPAPAAPPLSGVTTGAITTGAIATGAPAAQTAGPPAPRIITIDRAALLRVSSAGKAMMTSAQNLSRQADTEFKNQAEGLQKEATALQQQLAILAPDVRTQKQNEFNTKQEAFQKRVTDRQTQIQNGFMVAQQKVDQAMGPILQTIMRERGANLLLDRSAVIFSTIDVDVTATAVERLDRALPTVSVSLARTAPTGAPPAAPAAQR